MQVPPILEDHLCFRNSWSSVILGHFLRMAIKAFLLTHGISPSFVCPTIVNKASCTPDSNNWRSTSKGMAKFREPTAKYDFALALYDDLPVLFPVYIYIYSLYITVLLARQHWLDLPMSYCWNPHLAVPSIAFFRKFRRARASRLKTSRESSG